MKADPRGVLTGVHFMDGDHACCEGALAAGARFAAGYPITPSTEVVERFASRVPTVGGTFIQMEDELAASITLQGAVWGGAKAFTVTSGPGFSLMMEHIGYAAMTETPCVFVDVQRGGPSTGLPTLPAQADMMQARWGSHGDYEIIALCPNSPQECFDLTIKAFNLAEEFRVPVMFMMDEVVGHMTEKVVIPAADQIEVVARKHTRKSVDEYLPYQTNGDMVPEIAHAGDGYKFHVTGLTHDERGYPNMTPQTQDKLVRRLQNKIRAAADRIAMFEEDQVEGADVVVVSYGITSRVAQRAIDVARGRGFRVGKLRLITAWPFPEKKIRELATNVKAFVVPELNLGQMVREVERAAGSGQDVSCVARRGRSAQPRRHSQGDRGGKPMPINELVNPVEPFLRSDRMPHIWCPGCGIGTTVNCFARALIESKIDLQSLALVSGIGCTGRVAGYVKLDSFHTTHGRAIPFATGLKLANPKLNVVVYSGDGDLSAIGGNHLIHAARRNIDLKVICVNNLIYAMTGGQTAPTTPDHSITSTNPYGVFEPAFNLPHLVEAAGAVYVARWTTFHVRQLARSISEAFQKKGFSFIEVISPCPTLYQRRNKLGDGLDTMKYYKEKSKVRHGAPTSEVGLTMTGEIVVGKFVDRDRPDYQTMMRAQYAESLGERFVDQAEMVCS